MPHPALLILGLVVGVLVFAVIGLLLDGFRQQLREKPASQKQAQPPCLESAMRKELAKADSTGIPVTILPGTHFRFGGKGSLLAAMEAQGIHTVPSDCRVGSCGLCKMRVVDGEVRWLIQPEFQTEPDEVLLCCSAPKGELTLKH